MKTKKLLSIILSAVMVIALFSGCEKKHPTTTDSPSTTPTSAAKDTPAPTQPAGEALPTPVYYFSMDKKDDSASIQPIGQDTTADPILFPVDKEKVYIPGVKGDCIYVNGSNGFKLTNVNGVGETYTVSFWVYVRRLANYMPTIQFGPDVHGDATSQQHWVNITKQTWADDGNATFPVIWSDDVSTGAFPFFAEETGSEKYNEWTLVTLVVDEKNMNDEETMIDAQLYINGTEVVKKDAEGNKKPCQVVVGAMEASDNFDFLIGVNYWDAIFKGGIDEVYVFDKALTEGQVQTLYKDGDRTVAFDEPEHIFKVVENPAAIEKIGSTDLTAKLGEKYFSPVALPDGKKTEIKFTNFSDGKDTKNNYVMYFTKGLSEDPAKDAVATVFADATGDGQFTYTWGNWNTWEQKVMRDADVTLTIERTGANLAIDATNVDYDESANTMHAKVTTAEGDIYCYISCQNAYLELLSVKDVTPVDVDLTGKVVGSQNRDSAFWTEFSDIWAVPAGTSKTVKFKNYTAGENAWENFIVIIQSTPEGHSADTPDYKEYAVLRADNWGWGDNFANTDADKNCTWDFGTFTSDIDGADIEVTVNNDGAQVTVDITATTADGRVFEQHYRNIAVPGDVYLTFTLEKAFLVFEPTIIGSQNCDSPFWTEFSDIWAVPAGTSKTVEFTNYTAGENAWENFIAIIQSTPEGHSADTPDYKEYAVLRADNWGWGDNFANTDADKNCTWDFGTMTSDINGAAIVLTVNNDGTNVKVDITATTTDGRVFEQHYTNIAVPGDVYLTLTLEKAYLVMK